MGSGGRGQALADADGHWLSLVGTGERWWALMIAGEPGCLLDG